MSNKFRVLFIYPNQAFLNPAPVAIGILNALLKREGFDTDIFDNTFYQTKGLTSDKSKEENLQVKPFSFAERGIFPDKGDMLQDLKKKVINFKPNLIALSVLEGTYPFALDMLEAVKDYKIPIVAGGVFATMAPEVLIAHNQISFVCIGEGEKVLPELCQALFNGNDYTHIENLWIKSNGKIIKNKLSAPVNLDSLPMPDYSIFDERRLYRPMAGKVYKTVPIETNRGCPFQCTFCNSPSLAELYQEHKMSNYFRKKSLPRIYQELKYLIEKWDAEYVYFTSDTFLTMSDNKFDEFIDLYNEFNLPFWIQTRPETVTLDKMKRLKEAGCHRISIGLEHGNEEFRKKILKKNFKNEVFIKAAEAIYEAGIPLTVNNIIGFPFENRELIFDTIRLNRRLKFDSCNAYAFYPFRGTPLYELSKKEGFLTDYDNAQGCLTKGSRLNMPQLSNEEIKGLMRTFVLYTTLPESYFPKIKIAEQLNPEGDNMLTELREIYLEKFLGVRK